MWLDAACSHDATMRMTPDVLARFSEELRAVIDRYRDETAGATDGELVSIYCGAVPTREPQAPAEPRETGP